MTVRHDGLAVDWLGYATVRIEASDTVVYLDPGRYGVLAGAWEPDTPGVGHPQGPAYDARDGDLVCVSHVHHYDPDGIGRVAREDATVLVHEAIHHSETRRDVTPVGDLPHDVRRVGDTEDFAVDDVVVRTTEAYNRPDGSHLRANGEPVHPEGSGCGFHLTVAGPAGDVRVFWPGDTDVLDGHAELDVSLFLPPIGGTFTMDRHGAADLAAETDPDLVLPIHYNTFGALETDSREFAADVAQRGVPVVLDEG